MPIKVSFALFTVVHLATMVASSDTPERISGGWLTTIDAYPYAAAILRTWNLVDFTQYCSGIIITSTAILSVAQCYLEAAPNRFRARVGSSVPSSGGTVYDVRSIIIHQDLDIWHLDNDIAVLRTLKNIAYVPNTVQPASIAGTSYNLADNQIVWGIGWGWIYCGGPSSEQLRHLQMWTVNQNTCRSLYAELNIRFIPDSMVCAGSQDWTDRGQCNGDQGGPLVHNGVVVGLYSWGHLCGVGRYPSLNLRVSRYIPWIQANVA